MGWQKGVLNSEYCKFKLIVLKCIYEIEQKMFCENQIIERVDDMSKKIGFTAEEAKTIGEKLGVDWSKFDVEQFRMGLEVELEHGLVDPETNVTDDNKLTTGKIALAHLNEYPDYYTRLKTMEKEAKKNWENK